MSIVLNTFQEKVKSIIEHNDLLKKQEKVIVAFSGGADSVSLLLVLKELGYRVLAVHVNHNLRADESKRDENFCRDMCKRLNIDFFCENVDVYSCCKENKLSIEQGARELRYGALNKYAKNIKIATAHNISDSIETTIFNLSRGTGLKGLCGISVKRENIIRPILYCSREEIESYIQEQNESYVEDSTNKEVVYTRNKIRHKNSSCAKRDKSKCVS